jgi:arylsulfatase A-like enzyme
VGWNVVGLQYLGLRQMKTPYVRLLFSRIVFLLVAGTLPVPTGAAPLEDDARKNRAWRAPNIVYILADDFGYGDLHALNPQRGKIATPHLDRLASQGMAFLDAHSGSSVCTPTRYGLLTGRYAWRTRLQRGVLDGSDDPPLIEKNRLTVPSFLKQYGYATAAIGKWHLGFDSQLPKEVVGTSAKPSKSNRGKKGDAGLPVGAKIIEGPITRGFDYFWGCSNARTMSGLIENDMVIESIEPMAMLPRLGQRAVNYIHESGPHAKLGKPFFLYVPLTSPHTPIVPSAEWQGKSGLGSYADFVMQTDAVVGDLMTAIDQAGIAKNTIVVFTADNGCSPAAGTKELEKQGHFASGPFRGYKADIWEGGHRVPFLVRWPEAVRAGSVSSQTICHVDWLATCAEILEAKLPDSEAVDSVSILPALLGSETPPLREAVVHHSIDGMFSIRQGKWKLELCPGSGGWGAPKDTDASKQGLPSYQLYDLDVDASETKNVYAENPRVVEKLTKLLEQYVANGRSTPGPPQSNDVSVSIWRTANKKEKQ